MSIYVEKDVEKAVNEKGDAVFATATSTDPDDVRRGSIDEIAHKRSIQAHIPVLKQMRQAEEWLDRRLGVESRGIDRVPEAEKRPPSIWNIFLLWWSLNLHIGVVPLGLLGAEFGLSFHQNVAALIVGNILGSLCTAYTGTLSPKLGLRQIATSRYSFGFYGAKLCSVINIVVGGGYFVVNLVVVGQLLSAVADFQMSTTVGIVIIAVVSFVVSIFGYRIIHHYERLSWIVTFVLFLVLIGQVAPYVQSDASGRDEEGAPLNLQGFELAGPFLSILSIAFSNASGWCSIAGDYYVHYPANTSRWKIGLLTFFGVFIPVTFSVVVGALLGNAALNTDTTFLLEAYKNHSLGGVVAAIYHPSGWSKFCLVILTFSVLGNNIAVNYSSGLSLQLLGHYFHAVPRFIWTFVFAVVVAILAIAGQQNLSAVVNDFVSLLGYWTVCFTIVLLFEDAVFRRHDGYNLSAWNQPGKLPWGAAAVTALLAGYLAGGVPGMAQVWYVGPVAAKFGPHGGDVGIYLAFAISCVVYPTLRYFEKKYTGR